MRLRVGFTGGGGITETHACAARDCPDLEIAAFCGTNPEKVAALVDEHGGQGFQARPRNVVVGILGR